jgi:hypothetical protein
MVAYRMNSGDADCCCRRMPSLVWYGIKHQLTGYGWLRTRRRHRVLVNQWRHDHLSRRIARRYIYTDGAGRQFNSILADYLLGRWAGVRKPDSNNAGSPANCAVDNGPGYNRLVPQQPLAFDSVTSDGRPR